MTRYTLLILVLLTSLSTLNARPMDIPISAGEFAAYLGLRFDNKPITLEFGSSYRATVWQPEAFVKHGITKLKKGERLIVSNIGRGKIRVKARYRYQPPIFVVCYPEKGQKTRFYPSTDHLKPVAVKIKGKIQPIGTSKPIRIKADPGAKKLPF